MNPSLDLGVAVIAIVSVLVLLRWLPREVARQVVELYGKATQEQERATDEREALQAAAHAELTRVVALAYAAEKARDHAKDEREAMQAAAREAIRKAFVDAQGDHARFVDDLRQGFDVASIVEELRRDEESGRALLWYHWRLLCEALPCFGLAPPPEPPKFAARPREETRPDTKDERPARPPEPCPAALALEPAVEAPTDARATWAPPRLPQPAAPPPELTAADEKRIVERLDVLVRAEEARGVDVGHCGGLNCLLKVCACGCAPCVGCEQLRAQATREVVEAGLRAAALGRPRERRAVGFGEGDPEATQISTVGSGTARRKDPVVAVAAEPQPPP